MLASADLDPRKAGTIWALNLGRENIPVIQPSSPALFARVLPEQGDALTAAMGPGLADEICRRFTAGRHCYAAWMDDRIACYGWVSFDEEMVGELNLRLRLAAGEAYIWDCATLPEYRNQHLYSALLSYILIELRDHLPVCRAWIGADLTNIASQRGIARAGFHRVGNLQVERFLAMRLVSVEGAPGIPEAWLAEARRVWLDNRDNVWLAALSHNLPGQTNSSSIE
jgi:ribosomal protein S18 acetylase RimI-like enzyme